MHSPAGLHSIILVLSGMIFLQWAMAARRRRQYRERCRKMAWDAITAMLSMAIARDAGARSESRLGPEPSPHERAPHVILDEMAQGFEEQGDPGLRTHGKCGWMADPGPDAPPEGPASYHESPYRR